MYTYIYAYKLHYNHDNNNNDRNTYETHIIMTIMQTRMTIKKETPIKLLL